jgi:hypothetical protein
MIVLLDIIFALVFALLLTLIFTTGFKRKGPWKSSFIFFLVTFLATWSGGIWATPFGPQILGIPWIPFLIIALVVAIILGASVPPQAERTQNEEVKNPRQRILSLQQFDTFLIALIIILVAGVVVGYIVSS